MSSWTDPIPADGRLVRAVRRAHENVINAKLLAQVAREATGQLIRPARAVDAADSRTLRGIPAIGPGVAGCIPGTNPELQAEMSSDP